MVQTSVTYTERQRCNKLHSSSSHFNSKLNHIELYQGQCPLMHEPKLRNGGIQRRASGNHHDYLERLKSPSMNVCEHVYTRDRRNLHICASRMYPQLENSCSPCVSLHFRRRALWIVHQTGLPIQGHAIDMHTAHTIQLQLDHSILRDCRGSGRRTRKATFQRGW